MDQPARVEEKPVAVTVIFFPEIEVGPLFPRCVHDAPQGHGIVAAAPLRIPELFLRLLNARNTGPDFLER